LGILELIQNPVNMLIWLASLLIAITVHEFMHAWTANYLGDSTPARAGRVTLNPLKHLDPIGTIMLLLVRFGWGKPVPINPNNFKNPRVGSALTAVAGPMSNFLLANVFALTYRLSDAAGTLWGEFLVSAIFLNLVLMVFNLLPIPPLDGSKFFALFFPSLEDRKFESYGPFILMIFIILGGSVILLPVIGFLFKVIGMPNIV
jgi:Zn-dependent protease